MFHVVVTRTGPSSRRGRPLEEQTGWTEHAAFMDELHLQVESVEPWTIRLDGRDR